MTASADQDRTNAKSDNAFRTISEVATLLDVPQHVLRFWESKFPQLKPLKRGGGRRYYRAEDVQFLKRVRHLLYVDGYTIKGVQKLLRESGSVRAFVNDRPEEGETVATSSDAPALVPQDEPAPDTSEIVAVIGALKDLHARLLAAVE